MLILDQSLRRLSALEEANVLTSVSFVLALSWSIKKIQSSVSNYHQFQKNMWKRATVCDCCRVLSYKYQ